MAETVAIVMAAGKGTRMKSELPKVLIPVCGRPMIEYVIDALSAAGVARIVVVVGYREDLVREQLAARPRVEFVTQAEQLGTGHAVKVCGPALEQHRGPVIVVAGDSPMLQARSLEKLLAAFEKEAPAGLLGTVHKSDPFGLGRIVRDAAGNFSRIVEEKDATPEQRQITEVNLSCYVFDCQSLFQALQEIRANNQQREYYLTDVPGVLLAAGKKVLALPLLEPREALSINNPEELAAVEKVMRHEGP